MQLQPECKTAADFKASISKMEARLKAAQTTKAPAPVVAPAKPFNSTLAFYQTGKATGIHRAMGAAVERAGK